MLKKLGKVNANYAGEYCRFYLYYRRETLKGHDGVNGSQVATHKRVENQ